MVVKDVVNYLEKFGPGGSEEILLFGDIRQEVRGIAVCWMPTLEVISKAASMGCNLIICHENLTFPYNFYIFGQHLEKTLAWKANMERIKLLAVNNMSVIRAHAKLDKAYNIDWFREAMELKTVEDQNSRGSIVAIQETTLKELALHIKEKIGLNCIRVTGPMDARIRKVGIAVGGLGISVNMGFLQRLVDESVDVILTGEADEESLRFAEDSGVCFIETSHIVCESIGLAKFAEDLKRDFPDVKVEMVYAGIPWRYI